MRYTLGIAQIAPSLGDVSRNLERIEAMLEQARKAQLDLLVFPELALTGYWLKDMVPAVAQRLDSPVLRKLQAASKDVSLVVGFVEESGDYRYYNSAAYFEGGRLLHVHRKVYLPTYGMFDETRYFAAGDKVRAFDTRFGRIAILICEDLWHSSTAYIASQDGSELLIGIGCSPARGVREEEDLYSSKAWQTLNRMYALFFSQYVVFANRVGYEDGIGFWGGSEVIDPDGELVARAPYFEQDLLIAPLLAEKVRRARIASPLLRDERLDLTLRELKRLQRKRTE